MATQTGSIDLKGMTSAYSDQQQYFWVESSSSATWGGGAHITNIAESAFKTAAGTWGTDPTAGGYNLLMNTDTTNTTGSLQLRNGSLPIMNLDNDSLDFNTIDITGGTYRTVASFGETTQIGYDDETKMILSSNSFDMIDINGRSISHIGNPTNQLLLDVFFYDSTQTNPNIFVLSETPTTIEQVTINDVATTNYILHDLDQVTINDTLTDGDKISITYKFAGETSYYTFGYRKDGGGTEEDDYFTVGQYSFASGCLVSATGTASHAEGYNTEAKGHSSHAEGHDTIAWQDHAHAEGDGCQAEGTASHAEGYITTASGSNSHAEGFNTTASGFHSHAEGYNTTASGYASHAEGYNTTASGFHSHAEGINTTASGSNSHAEGANTTARGYASHASCSYTVANENDQTVIGKYNAATVTGSGTKTDPYVYSDVGDYAFIIGNGTANTTSKRSNALTVDWFGNVNIPSGASYQINGVPIADYIVEQGTTGKWYYEKYNSGLIKGWYFDDNTTTTLTTSSGNGWYRNANPYSISMSGLGIVGVPRYASVTVNCGLAHVFATVDYLAASSIQYYVSHLGTYSNRTTDIHATVVGRWK